MEKKIQNLRLNFNDLQTLIQNSNLQDSEIEEKLSLLEKAISSVEDINNTKDILKIILDILKSFNIGNNTKETYLSDLINYLIDLLNL